MRANKAVLLAPKAAFDSFQGKQLMGLPFGIADHKYRTGTLTVAQVDDEEKSPLGFGKRDGTRCKGAATADSYSMSFIENSAFCAFNACPEWPRRVPRGETSRKAGCRKSARPV